MDWGVVVAADEKAEWLLPWWWKWYSKHQRQKVAFIDFGMSDEAQTWCLERGLLVPFSGEKDFTTPKQRISLTRQKKWESLYGPKVWEARASWFKKPLAMLQSPFKRSVWMDLDCEVCQPIDDIFANVKKGELAAVKVERWNHYNSGVVAFDQTSPLLHAWADLCLKEHASSIGDEVILSKLIQQNKYPFKPLAKEYNWVMGWGYHPDLKIAHWVASWGKLCIESMGGIQAFTSKLLPNSVQ